MSTTRRAFIGTLAGGALATTSVKARATMPAQATARPAILGGTPVRTAPFASWPLSDQTEERALLDVLKSGRWGRTPGRKVESFEAKYASLIGSKHALLTANGTSALLTVMNALDIGPGDEVIVPPYTFIATINVILARHALPVFVDSDLETFQIDATKIDAAVTGRTRAIMPVHLGGSTFDVDTAMATAEARRLPLVEDACQSHLAEWKGRRVGSYGTAGCFSFQASKNLNSGEGGAITTSDDALVERCYEFHQNSRGRTTAGSGDFQYTGTGLNLRLTEFQAALLEAQLTRLDEQARTRDANGAHLTSLLSQIPGITPAKMYPGTTRNAYHLYMFRYDAGQFAGLSRDAFLKALRAEGVPASSGYGPLNKEPFLERTLTSRGYRAIYDDRVIARWRERNQCPVNDRLCAEAVWFTQTMLLGPKSDMDQIADAIRRIQTHAPEIARAS